MSTTFMGSLTNFPRSGVAQILAQISTVKNAMQNDSETYQYESLVRSETYRPCSVAAQKVTVE